MAQMAEMMEKLPPDQREQMMQMMAQKGGGKGMGGKGMGDMMGGKGMGGKGMEGKGMDGKGGKGGKGGPPPPKEMTVKKARSMMKELRAALNSASALEAFAGVEGEGKERVEKVAPMAEKFAQSVVEKYGFESGPQGGLQHAVQSAVASGEGDGQADKKIRTVMEEIEEKIVGKPSKSLLGRVAALDALAEKFVSMDAAARSAAITEAEGTSGGEVYATTMSGIVEKGDTHIVDAVVDLVKKREQEDNKTDVQVRMNIFQEFLQAADLKAVGERLRAEQPAEGDAPAGHGDEL